ncbi:diaminopimelate epimerase [Halobacterium jilantaiense]|uniref:Diaminopimelate epimerase n=1 Tax=Halobacterium jilantaiense TaxID=355548 RepID=A0A1I0NSX3_9EURY|nr:diaminopimelate epimerase [Halobacterium jilantaiense]SEW04764.1 diaminopimelate epimerase [Halobacterium jilantaiense]
MISHDQFHGTGNDFAIVDAAHYVPDRAAFAEHACATLGVDGVLFLAVEPQYTPPRAVMTLVQPDGSTAAMCGNGARCAARWVAEREGVDTVMLDTQAGTRRAEVDGDTVTVEMGEPAFDPGAVPVARDEPMVEESLAGFAVTAVNTGVPHAVAFVDDVDGVDLDADAPAVRHHDAFPEGANVTLASPDGEGGFRQRTFERGVEGETQSCGTGAVAIAVVAARLGLLDNGRSDVAVRPPGGTLRVDVSGDRALLTGPTEREDSGELERRPARRVDA